VNPSITELEATINEFLARVSAKISELGLSLAVEKTQAVVFTNKNKWTPPQVILNGQCVSLSREMTYLGIVIDDLLMFKTQMKAASNKARKVSAALAQLMPNIGGPREIRRMLLTSVVHSVLLYEFPGRRLPNMPRPT